MFTHVARAWRWGLVRDGDGRTDRVLKPGVGHSGAKPRRGPGRAGWEGVAGSMTTS